jgi:hypothetical protein
VHETASGIPVDQALQRAEAVFLFTQEVNRRLAEHGIAGMDHLASIHRQLLDAVSRISLRELDWASCEAEHLRGVLAQISSQLGALSALKAALEVRH